MPIRILQPYEVNSFDAAIDSYFLETDHLKGGYTVENRKAFVVLHKDMFRTHDPQRYVVSVDQEDYSINGLAIGFNTEFFLNRHNQDILSSWHLSLTWRRNTTWGTPKAWMFNMLNPIAVSMEKRRRFEFTKVIKLKNTGTRNVVDYAKQVVDHNLPDGRYDSYIEAIVGSPNDVQALPLVYRGMFADSFTGTKIVINHVLKNNLRSEYL